MKNTLLPAIAILLLVFASCGNENGNWIKRTVKTWIEQSEGEIVEMGEEKTDTRVILYY